MIHEALTLGLRGKAGQGRTEVGPFSVTVARTVAEAAEHIPEWQALADRAADANVFYEPWCFLPALERFGAGKDICLVFLYQTDFSGAKLAAVFPLEQRQKFHGLPLRHLVAWRHPHLFLAQPLVDQRVALLAWRQLLRWAHQDGAWFVDLPEMLASSQCFAALQAAAGWRFQAIESFERTILLGNEPSAEAYIARTSSSGSRKDWRRLFRRLAEAGQVETRVLQPGSDARPWIDAFLAMEAAGWKGREGTALASDPQEEAYFREIALATQARSALHMAGLFVDGRPIALQCNLFAHGQGSAFKVTYDEAWAQFSPGVLLELEAIRDLYVRPGFISMDSCTGRNHPLMNRLWRDARRIVRCRVATRSAGAALLALRPAVEFLGRGRKQ
jgi:CelD/BcsL family acetyltransferase involved in cellulose biosynthesis